MYSPTDMAKFCCFIFDAFITKTLNMTAKIIKITHLIGYIILNYDFSYLGIVSLKDKKTFILWGEMLKW
jgi:hypothetical protein